VELVGPDGLLAGLTKNVLEAGLEAEMSEHLGYDKHHPAGRNKGNSRNGARAKTLLTDVGPIDIEATKCRPGRAQFGLGADSDCAVSVGVWRFMRC